MKTSLVSARDLRVISNDIKDLNEIKVLIVASGGLRGKEYDQSFWQKLGQYVWDGGYLVVLDQPYGNLYSRLPGSPQARGWEEDLSCTGLFTLLQENDPVVHGQSYKQCQYPTDGYFTWLPPGAAKHSIRMLRGGAASAITYHYGQGRVFAAT